MAGEKAIKATKIKKKKWIQVVSPTLFRNEPVGEIPVVDPQSLIGRTVTVNMMSLTRDIKKQNTNIKLIITSIKGDKAVTSFYGYSLNPSSIKRLIRRGKEKTNLSIVCKTSDNKRIRIKPLMVPFSKVKGSVSTSFRREATNYLTAYAAKTTFENIIKDTMTSRLQRELKGALKKIYPVRIIEISKLHIETEKKSFGKKAEIELKEEPEEKVEEPKLSNESENGLEKSKTFQKEEKKEVPKKEEAKEKKQEENKEESKKEEPKEKTETPKEEIKKEEPKEEKKPEPKEEIPKKTEEKKVEPEKEAPKK